MKWLKQLFYVDDSGIATDDRSAADELHYRLARPQRHRLLHGYPQVAAMISAEKMNPYLDLVFNSGKARQLLIGILPHPFCNPAVTGCGFCTFPHEPGNSAKSEQVVATVILEIISRLRIQEDLQGCPVTGLYFGGGTANLTAPGPFEQLCQILARGFDFSGSEVTLEGVPANFLKEPLLVDIMRAHLPARHHRISMGIQSFSEHWLGRMGRLAFGTAETFRQVVELAHARGLTVSADMLINLPGQTREEMRQDIRQAIDIAVDHLGVYHLVLFEKLGTEWSRNKDLLAALPGNEEAADNWLDLRELLLSSGFYQATLTNFEQARFRGQADRFIYEECSFHPDRYDMLGFGPSAISYVADSGFQEGIKTLNPDGAAAYMQAVNTIKRVWDRFFVYGAHDQRVGYLTRRLAGLEISRDRYLELFGSDPLTDFAEECAALAEAGLLGVEKQALRPTPRGMFYADSIAALWAWKQVRNGRAITLGGRRPRLPGPLTMDRTSHLNESRRNPMG
jgi:oxygen-independent coproporphyrinogen-3 oxidase